ncbi:enolase-like isoform X1 [Arachis stenosperma]|uniref:enolase-like isoform X1 n=1 Tax=Arachis stenosperma TaxID=217475 RepID=UPI0025AC82FC|nr:enolase-like isoform X1 [Arachis stenosperma]
MMRKEDENDESIKESSSLRKILAVNFNFLHMLVGDDFLMFNAKRIERVVLEYACNALFLKVLPLPSHDELERRHLGIRTSWTLP